MIGRLAASALLALSLTGCAAGAGARPAEGSATLRLGESARVGGLAVRAFRVEEDSRCPASVHCVQAGTVRLAVALGTGGGRHLVLRLDEPLEVERGRWLSLLAVCPAPRAPGAIRPADYRFILATAHGAPPAPLDHACPPAP